MDIVLFDLDNTLYPRERNVFALIDKRINRYMEEVVAIPTEAVDGLRRSYWKAYGATLQGLIRHYGVDPEDYLDYVHEVDVHARLQPDTELRSSLALLPSRRFVFTNGSRAHAERVLDALGLSDQFEDIFDIRIACYQPKPSPDPYLGVLRCLGSAGERCIMVEDMAENLATAKQLGMTTLLVGPEPAASYIDHVAPDAAAAARLVTSWF